MKILVVDPRGGAYVFSPNNADLEFPSLEIKTIGELVEKPGSLQADVPPGKIAYFPSGLMDLGDVTQLLGYTPKKPRKKP